MKKNRRVPKQPDLDLAKKKFCDFLETVAALRHPETGCPWDNEQNHKTLTKYMIEEAYEAAEAMSGDEPDAIADELGDVLLQVVLNSQVALDEGTFSITDVINLIDSKMRRRHPHVFAKASRDKEDIKKSWQKIKSEEAALKSKKEDFVEGIFRAAKVHKVRPANLQAHKIGELAKTIDFDWKNLTDVLSAFESEVQELKEAIENKNDPNHIHDELGDVYFTLSQLSRHLGINGEMVAQRGNQKFLDRFAKLEELAVQKSINVREAKSEILENLWIEAKSTENQSS